MTNKKIETTDQVTSAVAKTEADKIWEEIRALPIHMFGLPHQLVAMYCKPKAVEPSALYLTLQCSAVLPVLELALGSGYTVEQITGYVVVRRAASK